LSSMGPKTKASKSTVINRSKRDCQGVTEIEGTGTGEEGKNEPPGKTELEEEEEESYNKLDGSDNEQDNEDGSPSIADQPNAKRTKLASSVSSSSSSSSSSSYPSLLPSSQPSEFGGLLGQQHHDLFQRNEELETVVGEQEEELVAQREQLINRDCQILELLSLVEDFEQRLNKTQLSEEDAKNVNCYVEAVRATVLVDVARPSARSLRSSTQLNKITPKSKSNLAPLQPGQYREGMDQKELELNTNFVSHAKK
jgi:hypothetical protein